MSARIKDLLPVILPALCLLWLVSVAMQAGRQGDGYHFGELAKVPVLANGRVQPLGSVARNALLVLRGKQELRPKGEETLAAMPWLLEVLFNPDAADVRKLFVIHHGEVLSEIGKSEKDGKLFCYAEIQVSREKIETEAARIAAIEQPLWKAYERALMKLQRELQLYENLRQSLFLPGSGSYEARLAEFRDLAEKGSAEMEKRAEGKEFDGAVLDAMTAVMTPVFRLPKSGYFIPLPPLGDDSEWRRIGESMIVAIDTGEYHPYLVNYARIADGYGEGGEAGVAKFNQAVLEMRYWVAGARPVEARKAAREVYFNRLAPFYLCMVLYVLAFLAAILSWLGWGNSLAKAAFRILLLGFLLHTGGLIARMLLEGRPPVTNLYSSAVFIGWGAITLSIVLEMIYKKALGTAVAAVIGFSTLVIAHHLSLNGDTLEMMRAVLDSNFWLATHVIVVTLGYSATFLAGILAIFAIIGRSLGQLSPDTRKALRGMVYGIVCFATLFSFVGTVLGGIWADQSWGRFWGWDPKENGAVLIVLWNATILHARWGGMIKERGLMMMAVFGNVVTSWSWFGTNMLGVGLHSYGFLDAAYLWLIGFVVSQLLVMLLAAIRMREPEARPSSSVA